MRAFRCPSCVREGTRSTVTVGGGGFVTLMGWSPFYDENGNYHTHNPNDTGWQYWKCSAGHHGRMRSGLACRSCDYGGTDLVIEYGRCLVCGGAGGIGEPSGDRVTRWRSCVECHGRGYPKEGS